MNEDEIDEEKLKAAIMAVSHMLERLQPSLEDMTQRIETQRRGVVDVDFVEAEAVEQWQHMGADCFILRNRLHAELAVVDMILHEQGNKPLDRSVMQSGAYNGYCRFPKLPGLIPGYHGIYAYVPVHGGITFFQEWANGSVTYGFDTAHYNSSEAEFTLEWMRDQVNKMVRNILIAARFERYYLKANEDNQRKARILDRMFKFMPRENNFLVMVNLLSGEL